MLELDKIEVHLAGIPVLNGIDMRLAPGQIYGVLGPNGAGKTTLLRTIVGLVRQRSGSIRLGERNLSATPSHIRARYGIGYMPEDRRLVPVLTAEENILSPAWAMSLPNATERLERIYDSISELRPLRHLPASALSGGQQKLVALARALLAGRNLLLLDEPSEGVAPILAARLAEILHNLRGSDIAVLVAESNDVAFAHLFDEEYALERGQLKAVLASEVSAS
jgi:branched-chain amino acid transport system ATP-binding protein